MIFSFRSFAGFPCAFLGAFSSAFSSAFSGAFLALILLLWPTVGWAAGSAVIFMYHRFGENQFPTTNIRMEQFEEHIKELTNGPYTVLPIPEIINRIQKGQDLPDHTVGLSIDDAYLSAYEKAWPRLRRARLPFTLFVATNAVDRHTGAYMTWKQIRELNRHKLVTIGSQTAAHPHMLRNTTAQNVSDIAKSNERFEKELNQTPDLFAYPYGEYSVSIAKLIKKSGFKAAFGQHSGVVFAGENFYALPRFALNEEFGGLDRFKLAANALALPVRDVVPSETLVLKNANPPTFGFTVDKSITNLKGIACFASGMGKVSLNVLGGTRVEVRLPKPFPRGRARINCTKPGKEGRWYWFGRQFFVE